MLNYAPDYLLDEDTYDDLLLAFDKQNLCEKLGEWERDVIEIIAQHKLSDKYLRGSINGILVDLLSADDLGDVGSLPFHNVIALLSMMKA